MNTVLVANRGEIAVRVIRTLKSMGIRSVAVYSDADAGARHVAAADVAVAIGPAPARDSYLNIAAIVDAAVRTGAQAVHPGYGFLSENADFAAALAAAGVTFIGPPVGAIQTMGDKIAAKGTVSAFGVPVVPGIARPGLNDEELIAAADEIGYPVLVKPSAGGGGKGMRMVEHSADLPAALVSARRESAAAFGDDTLFLERFVLRPRHIEVQVLADTYGNVVHFGERECSLQRRHQKVIEEAPSPLLDAATRARIGAAACDTARSVDYTGAGTVEFIVSADRPDEFFFMEMNTRLQVEHPVTELVTGWDLVEWQVRIAAGEKLTVDQADIALQGMRLKRGSTPRIRRTASCPPAATCWLWWNPRRPACGSTRACRRGWSSAATTTRCWRKSSRTARIGPLRCGPWIGRWPTPRCSGWSPTSSSCGFCWPIPMWSPAGSTPDCWTAAPAISSRQRPPTNSSSPRRPSAGCGASPAGRRPLGGAVRMASRPPGAGEHPAAGRRTHRPRPHLRCPGRRRGPHRRRRIPFAASRFVDDQLTVTLDGLRVNYTVAAADSKIWLAGDGVLAVLDEVREAPVREEEEHSGDAELISPMPGAVVAVGVDDGAEVEAGAVVVTVEAMKMEHALTAPVDGVVELLVAVGDQVKVGQPLARIRGRGQSS